MPRVPLHPAMRAIVAADDTEVDMSEIADPAMQARTIVDDRDEFIRHLVTRYKTGLLDKDYVLQGIAEFDALAATRRMRLYSVLATFAAAVAAVASAVTAYFAYVGIHH
jgi:hypothetical protein